MDYSLTSGSRIPCYTVTEKQAQIIIIPPPSCLTVGKRCLYEHALFLSEVVLCMMGKHPHSSLTLFLFLFLFLFSVSTMLKGHANLSQAAVFFLERKVFTPYKPLFISFGGFFCNCTFKNFIYKKFTFFCFILFLYVQCCVCHVFY